MNTDTLHQDPKLVSALVDRILRCAAERDEAMQVMEVCGTHTHVVSAAGLRSRLAPKIRLISGPGCPVCVTPMDYLDRADALARRSDVIVVTFGDLFRVPSSTGTLEATSAETGRVKAVYSPCDAVRIAKDNPDKKVVFLAIGFETTVPTIAAMLDQAERQGVANLQILPGNKLVPPALRALASDGTVRVHGLLLPGHVSVIIGAGAFGFLATEARIPGTVVGFSGVEVLRGVLDLVTQLREGQARVTNLYDRVVTQDGNKTAQALIDRYFMPADANWRGLGPVPGSGLALRPQWEHRDASRIAVDVKESKEPPGCRCGDVLKGIIEPPQCPLFAKACSPDRAVGACMVSTEGTCAAWYRHEQWS